MKYLINQDNYHTFETLAVNRLAPRSYFIPYPDRQQAQGVSLRQKRYASPKVICLSGSWDFHFYEKPALLPSILDTEEVAWERIPVPGCWQFQGVFPPALLLYHIQIGGSFFSICAGILLSIAAMFSMGFLLTAIGRDLKSTTLLCYLFYFVMLFLSGATMPDMLFPDTMKKISALLPMTYAVDLMQGIFAGDSLSQHTVELLILGILTVVCTIVGAVLYGRKDWT